MTDVGTTFGALLVGALVAVGLSGVVTAQASLYYKLFPTDSRRTKLLVSAVWILDICHSAFVCVSIWKYLINGYGDSGSIDHIPWSIAMTIALTAILTFLVHIFFAQRIYRLSKGNWYIAGFVALLALFRLVAACVTTAEMFRLGTFSAFVDQFSWVFTLGLAISSAIDVLVTGLLFYFLRTNRTTSMRLNHVMDMLMLYAFENGSITCASTITSMICWLVMPHNRIFLGLHFVISKLYANSLLATLITREELRHGRSQSQSEDFILPVMFPDSFDGRGRSQRHGSRRSSFMPTKNPLSHKGTRLQVNVEKTIQSHTDALEETSSSPGA